MKDVMIQGSTDCSYCKHVLVSELDFKEVDGKNVLECPVCKRKIEVM